MNFIILGKNGSISDFPHSIQNIQLLEPILEDKKWSGFKIEEHKSQLEEDEIRLMGSVKSGVTITSRMDDMKRIGYYRLLKKIYDGRGGYPLEEALDDMVVDYLLDKIGFYRFSLLMSSKSKLGFAFYKSLSKLALGFPRLES